MKSPRAQLKQCLWVGATLCLLPWGRPGAAVPPWDSYRFFLRGVLADHVGRPAEALAHFEKALNSNPQDVYLLRSYMESALAAGQPETARAAAERLAALRPTDAASQLSLGRVYFALGDAAKAQQFFAAVLKTDPANAEAADWLTRPSRPLSPADTVEALQQFLDNNSDPSVNAAARNRLAQLLETQGDDIAAESHWRSVLESDPRNAEALLGLAGLYDVRLDTAAAQAAYERYLAEYPDDADVEARLGQLYLQGGDAARAAVALEHAALAKPDDPTLAFWRALCAEDLERWEDAVRWMTRVVKKVDLPGATLRLASYHQRLGHHKKTIQLLRRLQRRHPDNIDFAQYLAQAYDDADRPRDALRWYGRVLEKEPTRADVQFRSALQWDRLKKFERAVPFLERAIALNPQDAVALNYLGYSWADRGERLDEALALIQRAEAIEPENAAFRDSRGWALFRMGRLAEAETVLAASVHPANDATVWAHYGDVLLALGKKEEALRAWQEGILLDPDNRDLLKRLGVEGTLKNVAPLTAARTLLKRVEGNFRLWRSAAAFIEVDGRWDKQWVSGRGVWYYGAPDLLRLELLGPLMAPEVLVIHTSSGTRWAPPDLMTAEVDRWFSTWVDVFSGAFFKSFDDPAVTVRFEGARLVYDGPQGVLKIDRRAKTLSEATVRRPGEPDLRFAVERTQDVDGLLIPTAFRLESTRGKLSFSLSGLKINTSQDPHLFEWPLPPPH